MPTGVSDKGRILSRISAVWFAHTAHLVPNHLISADWTEISAAAGLHPSLVPLAGRSTLVRRAQRIDVECVVRGYLAGSGWAEYQRAGTLAGEPLPTGLREGDALPEPAFTPAIKNDRGHDENISTAFLAILLGADLTEILERLSRDLYTFVSRYASEGVASW